MPIPHREAVFEALIRHGLHLSSGAVVEAERVVGLQAAEHPGVRHAQSRACSGISFVQRLGIGVEDLQLPRDIQRESTVAQVLEDLPLKPQGSANPIPK